MSEDWPRVTEVIRAAGLMGPMRGLTDWHLEKGKATHLACELLDRGTLDRASVDPEIAGRLAAYERWKREAEPEIVAIEQSIEQEQFRYRGTLDRCVIVSGNFYLLDIKGPMQAPWHGIQTVAYATAEAESHEGRVFHNMRRRASLHLHDDGTYRLIEHKSRDDWRIFQSALAIWWWRHDHGLITREGE